MSKLIDSATIHRHLLVTFWSIPILTMLIAYLAICFYAESLWPWLAIVHESGDRTLLDTVLYYQHAARELPLDLILGIAVGASVAYVFPQPTDEISSEKILRRISLLAIGTLIIIGIILTGTIITGGREQLFNNLLQMHTRPGEPLNWGSHWRYHLLSRFTLMSFSFSFAGILLFLTRGRNSAGDKRGVIIFLLATAVFALLTIVFIPDLKPFFDVVFLGHQVREVFTHILVTVPIAWAVCLLQTGHNTNICLEGTAPIKYWPAIAGFSGVALGLYLLVAALSSSSASHGQTDNTILLIFPHFFEHSFTYFVVPLVASLTYQIALYKNKVATNSFRYKNKTTPAATH